MTDPPTGPQYAWTAQQAVSALKSGYVSQAELLQAAIDRIQAVDHQVNALPIRCFDRARSASSLKDLPLAGLPIAVKDYNDIGGVRTTYGSPIFTDFIPENSDVTVAQLERNGAVPIAKSNVPEWAGGHTFNPVNGLTRNPWNLGRSAGGSSGGSAAALASGQVWLATGNDLGGSLRTPAGFNGIVGLRPSPGRVPRGKRLQLFDTLWVEGPMARNVGDVALMFSAGVGGSVHDPLAFDSGEDFRNAAASPKPPRRVAFSPDLGIVPVAREVADITGDAATLIAKHGIDVTQDIPNFAGVRDAFQTLRGVLLGTMMADLVEHHRHQIHPDIIGNVERGFAVTPEEIFKAERTRWDLASQMADFFESHDLLICPTASIPPFPVEQTYVTEIDGHPCETYIDWFAVTFAITMTACPVISLPCGLTADGLPVGLQLVGKPRGEVELLRAAAWIEQHLQFSNQLPIDPRPA